MRRQFLASLVLALLLVGLAAPVVGALPWQFDYDKALAEAKTQHRAILLDFTASWCGPCRMMENTTFVDPKVQRTLEGYTLVKIDIDQQPLVASRYKVQAIPACIVLNEFSETVSKHVGYADGAAFWRWLDQAEDQELARTKVSQADALAERMKSLGTALNLPNPAERNKALAILLNIYCGQQAPERSAIPDSANDAPGKAVASTDKLPPEGAKLIEDVLREFVQRQGPIAVDYLKDPRLAVRILFARLIAEKAGPGFQYDPWAAAPARTAATDAWKSQGH